MFELTNINRERLRQWLPWLDYVKIESDTLKFIEKAIVQNENSLGATFVILHKNIVGGVIAFHPLNKTNNIGEIGYWLSKDLEGKGIITLSCKALIKLGFESYNLNRIQIAVAENNYKSRSVPERLGFKYEGIIRDRECLYGNYVNHAMYSILKNEYKENETKL